MKRIFPVATALLLSIALQAQQNSGKVTYERVIQMHIELADDDPMARHVPKERTDRFELVFGNNQSLWKHVDEETAAQDDPGTGGGIQIRVMGPGQEDIQFCDFSGSRTVEQRELFDQQFIVEDSIRPLQWKMSADTRTLLGHLCRKAVAQRTGRRMMVNMENGVMTRKEVPDSTVLTAWFTPDIPVPAGPEVPGQLPGLILALDINNGRMVYKALAIDPKADLAVIKKPGRGKKLSPAQFIQQRDKMMAEMQQNMPQGGHRIQLDNQ
jgi:GLPGLI family protein